MKDCIFCRIVAGELPCGKVYEDDEVLAFHDIHPMARVHFMIIPKIHVASLETATPEHQALLGRILLLAPRLAREQGLTKGFRTLIRTGPEGGQEVPHIHVHVYGGGDLPSR